MDKYSKHEAMHTAWLASEFVERYVYQHPAVEADDKARELAMRAIEALCELYQYIGQPEAKRGPWHRFLELLVDD